jgi:hypothetical protein
MVFGVLFSFPLKRFSRQLSLPYWPLQLRKDMAVLAKYQFGQWVFGDLGGKPGEASQRFHAK